MNPSKLDSNECKNVIDFFYYKLQRQKLKASIVFVINFLRLLFKSLKLPIPAHSMYGNAAHPTKMKAISNVFIVQSEN